MNFFANFYKYNFLEGVSKKLKKKQKEMLIQIPDKLLDSYVVIIYFFKNKNIFF